MGANPLAIAGAGLGVVGAFGSFFGKRDQAEELRRQAREQLRREQASNNQTLGTARVRAAAGSGGGGLEFGSTSLQDWLTAMDQEFTRQEQWNFRVGMKQASALESSALWGLIGDLGGTMTQFGAANNWWKPSPDALGSGAPSSVPYYLAKP